MGVDVTNATGSTTIKNGAVTVGVHPPNTGVDVYATKQYSPDDVTTLDSAVLSGKYDNRFDDPTYYG